MWRLWKGDVAVIGGRHWKGNLVFKILKNLIFLFRTFKSCLFCVHAIILGFSTKMNRLSSIRCKKDMKSDCQT